ALATALVTRGGASGSESDCLTARVKFNAGEDFAYNIAEKLAKLIGPNQLDGLIIDNQLG
ncbi:unnamed protein product, partial [marine sediment metagenome]